MASKQKTSSKRKREEERNDIDNSDDDFVRETVVKKKKNSHKVKDKTDHSKRKRKHSSSAEEDNETTPSPKKRHHVTIVNTNNHEEEAHEEEEENGEEEDCREDEIEKEKEAKPKTKKFPITNNTIHKPARAHGWLFHIAAVAITSCLKYCQKESIDLRKDNEGINWSQISQELFTSSDIQNILYYIEKQYPDESIEDLLKLLPSVFCKDNVIIKEQHIDPAVSIPAKPKKPMTAYMIFYLKKRPKLSKKYPDLKQHLIAKKLGEIWQQLSAKKKQKYEHLFQTNKENYKEEMKQFYLDHPELETTPMKPTKSITKTKSKKTAVPTSDEPLSITQLVERENLKELKKLAPKKPLSTYFIFCNEQRHIVAKKYSDLTPVLVTKKIGEMWQSLSIEEKAEYTKIYNEDKERYEREIAEFWTSHPQAATLLKLKKPPQVESKTKEKIISKSSCSSSSEDENNEEESELSYSN